jgi:hypothetical protein
MAAGIRRLRSGHLASVMRESGDAAVVDVLDLHLANAKPSPGVRDRHAAG